MLDQLRGGIQGGALNGTAPTNMLISLEHAHRFYVSIFGGVEYLRADSGKSLGADIRPRCFNVADVPRQCA
jgi:hypothetical protein